jgi:uncharacterized repeat protein (TIGR01451 family)
MKIIRALSALLLLNLTSGLLAATNSPALPLISIGDVSVFEANSGSSIASFPITLSSPSDKAVSFGYATANDTASANTDYLATNGTFVFAPGVTNLTVTVAVNGDTVEEPNETFLVQLSNPVNALFQDSQAVGLILNDDNVAGKLDHFTWEPIAGEKTVLKPFSVAITARDALGDVVPNFGGTVELSAASGGGLSSTIVITEVDTGALDQAEFANVSGQSVDLSRWQIALYDASAWPLPKTVFTVPNGVSCPAGGVLLLREGGPTPGVFPAFSLGVPLAWNDVAGENPVAVAVLNPQGEIVDFFASGTADRARITVPALLTASLWSGVPMPQNTDFSLTYQRQGAANHHGPQDWALAFRSTARINPQMSALFENSKVVPISPVIANSFTNGTWRGEVSVLEYASNVVLRVDDGNGHHGEANPIALNFSNDLSLLVSASGMATILHPFTISITVSNAGPESSTGVMVTNTLAGARFSAGVTTQGAVQETNGVVVASVGTLDGGQQAVVQLTYVVDAFGSVTNVVVTARNETDPFPGNNQASTQIPVIVDCAGFPQGAIAWWSAEGNAVDRIGGNNGSLKNGVAFDTGEIGRGFSFDGVDAQVLVADNSSLAIGPGEDFSVEGWIRVPSGNIAEAEGIFDKRITPDSFSALGIFFFLANGRLAAQMGDQPLAANHFSTFYSAGPDLRDGQFHHVALSVSRNSTTGGNLYVDGKVVLTFDPTVEPGDLSTSAPLRIGHGANPIVPAPFKGIIDELVFYRRAISGPEVAEVFQAGVRGRCPDDLVVSTTGLDGQEIYQGEKLVFAVSVANFGNATASDVRFTNEMAQNVRYISAASSQGTVSFAGNDIVAKLGDIPPGVQVSVTISALAQNQGSTTNRAYAVRSEDERNLSNNKSVSVFTVLPDCLELPAGSSLWSGEGDARDQSGRNNGVVVGGAAFTTSVVGRGFHFDGIDDGILVQSSPSLNFGDGKDFSIEAWIRAEPSSAQEGCTIIDKREVRVGGSTTVVGYALFIFGGNLGAQIGAASVPNNWGTFQSAGPNLLDGVFHLVAVTVQRNSATGGHLYVDGSAILAFDPRPWSGDTETDQPLRIGYGAHPTIPSYFHGIIDEAAVHARALSADEIRTIYRLGAHGYCPTGTTDRDGDGLPDVWEMAHGLNRFDTSDAAADADGDGSSNLNEYLAGTDPQDAKSVFGTLLAGVTGAQVRVVIETVAGRHYRLEQTPSLVVPDWFPVGNVVTGTGGSQEVALQADFNSRQQFYRARLIAP